MTGRQTIATAVERRDVLPLSLPPRGLCRVIAAAYIGVSPSKFDEMIEDGRMPKSARQRLRDTEEAQSTEVALFEEFREQRRALALHEIEVPSEDEFVLVIAGVLDGKLVAYELDNDRKRLLAAVRQAVRTGGCIRRAKKKAA